MKKLILAITLMAGFGLQAMGAGVKWGTVSSKKRVACRAVNAKLAGSEPQDLGTIKCDSGTNYNDCCTAHFRLIFRPFFDNPSMQKFLTPHARAFFKDAQYQYVAPVK